VVPVGEGENDLLVVLAPVWRIRVLDDERAAQTIRILALDVGMVPISARLLNLEARLAHG
jgi:hypothetical protein